MEWIGKENRERNWTKTRKCGENKQGGREGGRVGQKEKKGSVSLAANPTDTHPYNFHFPSSAWHTHTQIFLYLKREVHVLCVRLCFAVCTCVCTCVRVYVCV